MREYNERIKSTPHHDILEYWVKQNILKQINKQKTPNHTQRHKNPKDILLPTPQPDVRG